MVGRSSRVDVQKDAKNSPSAQSDLASRQHPIARSPGHGYRLRKSHILSGHSSFSRVLASGRSLTTPPIRLFIQILPGAQESPKVGFAVSRSFRLAVKRNRIRRLMREAYRLHQEIWTATEQELSIQAVWMYTGGTKTVPEFTPIEQAVAHLMKQALGTVTQ